MLNVVARACFLSQSNQHHVKHPYHGIQIYRLVSHQCRRTRKANWSSKWRQCWIKYTEWKSTRNHNGCMVGRVRHKQQRIFIMNHQRKHKNTHLIHWTIMLYTQALLEWPTRNINTVQSISLVYAHDYCLQSLNTIRKYNIDCDRNTSIKCNTNTSRLKYRSVRRPTAWVSVF